MVSDVSFIWDMLVAGEERYPNPLTQIYSRNIQATVHLDRGCGNCFIDTTFNNCTEHGVQIKARSKAEFRPELVGSIPDHP